MHLIALFYSYDIHGEARKPFPPSLPGFAGKTKRSGVTQRLFATRTLPLPRRGAADHVGNRIAEILHPLRQLAGLDPLEPGVAEIALDQPRVTRFVQCPPDRDGLCPEATVGKTDDERCAGS